jgi:hypothetical protein
MRPSQRPRPTPSRERQGTLARNISSVTPGQDVPALITWESEIRAIAIEATAWAVETGGDLFGTDEEHVVIYLASLAGPDYLKQLSDLLARDWSVRYLGDWHSHHRLGLSAPSDGDRQRIRRLGQRNDLGLMAEIIVTLDGNKSEPIASLHPWTYAVAGADTAPQNARLVVAPGTSPLREALLARGALPEQRLDRWREMSMHQVRLPGATVEEWSPRSIPDGRYFHDRIVAEGQRALEQATGRPVERHATSFGVVLVAPVTDTEFVGFAIDSAWPGRVLEVDWIDRRRQSAEPVPLDGEWTTLNPQTLTQLYHRVALKRN